VVNFLKIPHGKPVCWRSLKSGEKVKLVFDTAFTNIMKARKNSQYLANTWRKHGLCGFQFYSGNVCQLGGFFHDIDKAISGG
jgi:hypothetical protein